MSAPPRDALRRAAARAQRAAEDAKYWVDVYDPVLQGLFSEFQHTLQSRGVTVKKPFEYGAFCRFVYDASSGKITKYPP